MAYIKQEDANTFKELMRYMYFSTDTVEMFLSSATAGQISAVNSMICHERMVRENRKRERLIRKAKFPQIKSFDGYDFTQIALPEGYSVDDLKSLSFIDSAQDFVFHGNTGRGKTHLAIAIGLACTKMGKSSYQYQVKVLNSPDRYANLRWRIIAIFKSSDARYGYRRIHMSLRNKGITASEKVVARIMKEEGLIAKRGKRRKYSSYRGELSEAPENLVNRNFHVSAPNKLWLTDITEFKLPSGKVYLSPIIDCFDGMVISWQMSQSPNADLANSTLDAAARTLKPEEHPIEHSDRGCHYRWPGWIDRCKQYGITRSMSKKGYSPDNSACEGFFGRLKVEFFYGRSWRGWSIEDFMAALDDYIHWYNEHRIKISLGGMSPLQYRRSLGLVA